MILHAQPNKPWNKHDFMLLEAYQQLEEDRCGQCGLPRYICHSTSEDIQFRILEDNCAATQKVDQIKAQRAKSSKKKDGADPDSGVALIPYPYTESGVPLSSHRIPYYEAEAARIAEVLAV
jgi:hypothetical protein